MELDQDMISEKAGLRLTVCLKDIAGVDFTGVIVEVL